MNKNLKQSVFSGIQFGLIIIFLVLVGAVFILVKIISKNIHFEPEVSLIIILTLIYLFMGINNSKPKLNEDTLNYKVILFRSIITGVVSGLLIGLMTFLVISLQKKGLNLRTYLYQLSPDSLTIWSQGFQPLQAAVFHFLFPIIACLFGGSLSLAGRKFRLNELFNRLKTPFQMSSNKFNNFSSRNTWGKVSLYGLLAVLLVIIPLRINDYWNFTLGTVGIYVLMGLGLNIVVGLAGLLDLGYVVFFAVGSYTMALLTAPTPHNILWDFWIALPIAIVLAAIIGVILGIPVLRLRGDYLAIVTLGFGEIIRVLLKAESFAGFSNGPRGIPKIGQPFLFGIPLNSNRDFMYMIILAVILVIFLTIRLQNSKIGRAWIAIREDETVAQAMGINTFKSKLLAFGIGAAFSGLGGALFASRSQFTGPDDFTLMISVNVLAVVIVGGMGSIPGVIAGAFVLKGLPEILRDLESYRILAFGALLVLMMIYRPQGLISSTRRRLSSQEDKKQKDVLEISSNPKEGS